MTTTNNVDQVTVGKPKVGGAVFWADPSTTMPSDATTDLSSAFAGLGYISEDGMTRSITRETTEIKDWGGDTIATPQTSKSETIKLKFVQALNTEVLSAVHGEDNVTGTLSTGLTIVENATELEEKMWVVEQIFNGNVLDRLVIPKGRVTEIGEIVYKADEVVGFELTITALPDTSGNTSYEHLNESGESGTSGTSGTP